MRLYITELYKLSHRKIFIMGILTMVGVLLIDYEELKGMLAHIDEMEYEYSQVGWNLFNVDYSSPGSRGETAMILFVAALGCIITILCIIKSYRRYRKPYDS